MGWMNVFGGSKQIHQFYELLNAQAHTAQSMADLLMRYIQATMAGAASMRLASIRDQADELEHTGDHWRQMIVDLLAESFVTPFDREDINDLSRAIDDIVDYCENTIKEIQLFEIVPNTFIVDMVLVMGQGVTELDKAVKALSTDRTSSRTQAMAAKFQENKMEGIYRHAIADLSHLDDIHELIKIREIYRHLSNAADRLDVAANLILRIIIKQYQ